MSAYWFAPLAIAVAAAAISWLVSRALRNRAAALDRSREPLAGLGSAIRELAADLDSTGRRIEGRN